MSIARYQGVDQYVGNTPLIRLCRLAELTGCEIRLQKALAKTCDEKQGIRADKAYRIDDQTAFTIVY
jgi:hypothetical protein